MTRPSTPIATTAAARMPQPVEPGLRDTFASLHVAADALRLDPSRMGTWRFLGSVLNARKALASHASSCGSTRGPLLHIEDARPRLRPRVQRCLRDHDRMIATLDEIIAAAGASEGATDAESLRLRALSCATAAAAHGRRVRSTVFEWAYRDIGGEAG